MGPCGELRYPSYMLSQGWQYPGVGLVMAHDRGMLRMLQAATGQSEPPESLPTDKNGAADDAPLFRAPAPAGGGGPAPLYSAGKGKDFLEWYAATLVGHGEAVLREAVSACKKTGLAGALDKVSFSVKVSGIHWFALHPSRAAEACAGYDNSSSDGADAYNAIARMLARVSAEEGCSVLFNFTCLEMNNWSNSMPHAFSAPEDLIAQVRRACVRHGVPLSGENALEFDPATGSWAFEQMKKQLRAWSPGLDAMHGLTILRLNDNFVSQGSLQNLREFVVSFPKS